MKVDINLVGIETYRMFNRYSDFKNTTHRIKVEVSKELMNDFKKMVKSKTYEKSYNQNRKLTVSVLIKSLIELSLYNEKEVFKLLEENHILKIE